MVLASRTETDSNGLRTRLISYVDPGIDGVLGTSDDVPDEYEVNEVMKSGLVESLCHTVAEGFNGAALEYMQENGLDTPKAWAIVRKEETEAIEAA